ncbi:hypothetical protein GCM10023336_77040 [Streptomyces similanensis]|uniref:Uncharacterized protein n=1 Tax=Streptomyces similanensis TaxID=1274988 RepID=A0ABP9LNT1_9ACTN
MAQRRQPRRSAPAGSGASARGSALLSVVSLVSTVFLVARYIFLSDFTIAAPAVRREPPAGERTGAEADGVRSTCADSAKVGGLGARPVSHCFARSPDVAYELLTGTDDFDRR